MKAVKVYEYRNCSTCKKALKFLESRGVAFEAVDITTRPPTPTELRRMIRYLDGNFKKLFNTSGQVYRARKLSEKLPKMTESQAVDLLASDGKLVKRPFVLLPDGGLVGFREEDWKKAFK